MEERRLKTRKLQEEKDKGDSRVQLWVMHRHSWHRESEMIEVMPQVRKEEGYKRKFIKITNKNK